MSVTRPDAIEAAKAIAQDPTGLPLLLNPTDYNLCCAQAIEHFRSDRPNLRVRHVTIAASASRYVLGGTGTILPGTGLDAWIEGASDVLRVFTPYLVGVADQSPIDPTSWRLVSDPDDVAGPITVLELLVDQPTVGSVMRLEYVRPHVLDDASATASSVRLGDVTALETLIAAKICEAAARRYVQNTGTSQFQTETIDRRSQSDVMKSRAKELMTTYAEIVGKPSDSVVAAGTLHKMVIGTSHGRGRLWHRE